MTKLPYCTTCETFAELNDAGDSSHPQCARCHNRTIVFRSQRDLPVEPAEELKPPAPGAPAKPKRISPDEGHRLFDQIRKEIDNQ